MLILSQLFLVFKGKSELQIIGLLWNVKTAANRPLNVLYFDKK